MSTHDTSVLRLTQYTQADVREILGTGEDPFGVADTGLTWLPKEEHFGIRHEGRLVAHAGLRRLPVSVEGSDLTEVVGLGGVAVSPDVRGRGLARRIVTAALSHARTMGPPHALLFCRPPLVPLYEHLGWHPTPTDAPVRVEQPGDRVVTMPLRTLVTPLHENARWPEGAIRLRSLPM